MHVFHYNVKCNFKMLRMWKCTQHEMWPLKACHSSVQLSLLTMGDPQVQVSGSEGTGIPIRRKAPSLPQPVGVTLPRPPESCRVFTYCPSPLFQRVIVFTKYQIFLFLCFSLKLLGYTLFLAPILKCFGSRKSLSFFNLLPLFMKYGYWANFTSYTKWISANAITFGHPLYKISIFRWSNKCSHMHVGWYFVLV